MNTRPAAIPGDNAGHFLIMTSPWQSKIQTRGHILRFYQIR